MVSLIGAPFWIPIINEYQEQEGLWRIAEIPRMEGNDDYVNYSNLSGGSWFVINNSNRDLAIEFAVEMFANCQELADYMKCLGETGSCDCCMSTINDIIVAYDFEIDVNDNVIATFAGERCGNVSTPFFRYKEYVFAWGGAYLNQYRYTWLLTPYLATICNLSQAVVKNADKTMKITYTLTEQTV